MQIGILKEIESFENRVAITTDGVKKLIQLGHAIYIQSGAGNASLILDEDFQKVGAKTLDDPAEIYNSDILLKVSPPTKVELEKIKEKTIIITFFQIKDQLECLNAYENKKLTLFSMSHIPRTTLAQNMDALSSQSNIAGYKSAIIGSSHIGKYMPLLMTAAGTIQPAKVLILGAGVAGLAAIATAKRLGAQVLASDVRPIVKEQVESLGAKFLEVKTKDEEDGVGSGGYAKETSDDYKKKQTELLNETIKKMDLVITTALIPERPAPTLISKDMVESMRTGSVIMDLAAANGGNCELTEKDRVVNHNGIIIDGMSNLPSTMPFHASELYSKNIMNLFNHLYKDNNESFNLEDEITNGSMLFNEGKVNSSAVQTFLDKEQK